jgi:hypothetical protein
MSSSAQRIGKHRTGRSPKLTEELLQRLVDPATNHVRDQVLEAQIAHHQLSFSLRTLREHCVKHKSRILMRRRPAVKLISSANKKARVQYKNDYESETVESFWQYMTFTDEAHVDSNQVHRGCILRKEGTRLHSDNLQEMPDTQRVKLHMAGFVSWHAKDSLIFYNDENDPSSMKSV